MTELPMQFPVLALQRDYGREAQEGRERLEWFDDEDALTRLSRWDLKLGTQMGALFVDAGGRCWRVLGVTDMGVWGRSWTRIFNIFRDPRRVRYELAEGPALPFDVIKERVCTSIQANPDDWRDDEAIAGEAGPPLDEQEMLDDLTERARRTTDMCQLIAVLEQGHEDA